jgi:hypothetical protein
MPLFHRKINLSVAKVFGRRSTFLSAADRFERIVATNDAQQYRNIASCSTASEQLAFF